MDHTPPFDGQFLHSHQLKLVAAHCSQLKRNKNRFRTGLPAFQASGYFQQSGDSAEVHTPQYAVLTLVKNSAA
jgi:hypothetical protein